MKMLKLSLLLNLLLAATLLFVISQRNPAVASRQSEAATPAVGASDLPSQVASPSSPRTTVESKPFSWSQVESSDYRVYVANLRRIGCPEMTIRDIIIADVHSAFAPRREALKRKNQNGTDLANRLSLQGVEARLEGLRDEEAQLIKQLLESPAFRTETGAVSIASARAQWQRTHQKPISVPLVLQSVDLATLNLDENRMKFISELRDEFVNEIGGYNQDPNDVEYGKRWQKAQAKSDELLQAMLGNRVYNEYRLRATPSAEISGAQR